MRKLRLILLILFMLVVKIGSSQEKIKFSPSKWDFGTILEQDGIQTFKFVGKNISEKPILIYRVMSSCGCTVPKFTPKPILPGETTEITVRFDPAGQFGIISRDLLVYSIEREKIATLSVRGSVTPRQKTTEELYPIVAMEGLRVNSTLCNFPNIYIGKPTTSTIGYVNATDHPIKLELRELKQSGYLSLDFPATIPPHERGEINFTYQIPATAPHYGTLTDLFEVWVNGKTTHTKLMAHGIAVDDPTLSYGKKHPRMQVSKNIVKFGIINRSTTAYTQTFTLKNVGEKELIIRKVESKGEFTTTLREGQRLGVGRELQVDVRINASTLPRGSLSRQLVLITNDPIRPIQRVKLTALID